MSEKKYVAYVGSYTHGSSRQGIHVYDVDVENGTLTERSSVEVLQCLNVIRMVICHVSTV